MEAIPPNIGGLVRDISADTGLFLDTKKRAKIVPRIKTVIKSLYDYSKRLEPQLNEGLQERSRGSTLEFGPLNELLIEGFDSEQIWAELQLQAEPLLSFIEANVDTLNAATKNNDLVIVRRSVGASEDGDSTDDGDSDEDDEESSHKDTEVVGTGTDSSDNDDDRRQLMAQKPKAEKKQQPSANRTNDVQEDAFFSLSGMDKFSEQLERQEYEGEESESDGEGERWREALYSGTIDERNDSKANTKKGDSVDMNPKLLFDQFFDPIDETQEDQGTDNASAACESKGELTPYEKYQQKLQKQIDDLEQEAVSDKPWQMTGEIQSSKRPENSLLEVHVDFETNVKAAPVITEEVTSKLEDIIKQRIIDESWDDVIRKEPDEDFKEDEQAEVSQEKSKQGIGELYEAKYMKDVHGVGKDALAEEKARKQSKTQKLFDKLCSKLDALANYHFTPKRVKPVDDVKPLPLPAIAMEEVIPLVTSSSTLQAPEEVYRKKTGRDSVIRNDSEMTREDLKRKRQAKKTARRKRRRQKQAEKKLVDRMNPGLGNKYSKQKIMDTISSARNVVQGHGSKQETKFGKSATFFRNLQNTVAMDTKMKKKKVAKSSNFKL